MNFNELVAEVTELTKRPDLSGRIRSAVREATMFSHRTNNFWRDLADGVLVPISSQEGVINAEDYLPRLRSIASIRGNNNGTLTTELEQRDVDDLSDEYGVRRRHWFYGTANGVRYNLGIACPQMQISYWRDPDVNPASFDSWIAAKYPDVIIRWACAVIYKSIGHTEEAQQEMQIAQAMLQQLTSGDFNIKGV